MRIPSDSGSHHRHGLGDVAAIAAIVIACHLALLQLPFVNFEWAFNAAANFVATGDRALAERYFEVEANSLVVPALGAGIARILGVSVDLGCRLLSILGVALVALALPALSSGLGRARTIALALLLLLNPLVWTFSGRGTADFFPAAAALCAIALLWHPAATARLGGVVLFALAVIAKYHAVLLLPLVALGPRPQSLGSRAVWLVATATLSAVALLIYNAAVHARFGFWLTPPAFQIAHAPALSLMLSNLTQYGGYLAILAAPLSFTRALLPWSWSRTVASAVGLGAAFAAGYWLLAANGEMSFGPFDRWISPEFGRGALASCCALFLISLIDPRSAMLSRRHAVSAAILLFVLCLSISRPSQRYLLLILPFYYVQLVQTAVSTRLIAATVATFVLLNALVAVNQVATGRVAAALADEISARGLVGQVDLGSYVSHLAMPSANPARARYRATDGCSDRALVCVSAQFGWTRQASIVALTPE